jgi:hypothetical protein
MPLSSCKAEPRGWLAANAATCRKLHLGASTLAGLCCSDECVRVRRDSYVVIVATAPRLHEQSSTSVDMSTTHNMYKCFLPVYSTRSITTRYYYYLAESKGFD